MKHFSVNKRRSARIASQCPVVVQGMPLSGSRFTEPTRATVISAHGALISLTAQVTLGQKLTLRNSVSKAEQECSVVYLGEHEGGRTEIGIEFKAPAPQFWGLENPPDTWKDLGKGNLKNLAG